MVKKFLLSAAVIGALATSAMAYDFNEVADMSNTALQEINASKIDGTNAFTFIGFNQTTTSNALIFPAYFAGNGWQSTIRVINTNSNPVIAKVVLYDGKDSHEVRDFNIYLSANDEWMGTIKVDTDGVTKVISTDDSTIHMDGTLASDNNPFEKSISSNSGYIEVIGMVSVTTPQGYEHNHEYLREAYLKFSKTVRNANDPTTPIADNNLIFKNGVLQNRVASFPFVNLDCNKTATILNNNNQTITYTFNPVTSGLTGDVRITDTVNGKDMDLPAYKVDYNTNVDGDDALVYLEGEKANLLDVFLDKNSQDYNASKIQTAMASMSPKTVYLTYGDASVNNMYALITNPFKRVYVQSALDYSDGTLDGEIAKNTVMDINRFNYYTDAVAGDQANTISSYGSVSLVAQVYDMSENRMPDSQFSPATTPTIKLSSELASTGYSLDDTNSLAYYLNQAENNGYKKGYVILTNSNTNYKIPGIVTQMLATTAGNRVVTNWIVPQQQQQ